MKYIACLVLLIFTIAFFEVGCGDNPITTEDQAEERETSAIGGVISPTSNGVVTETYQDDVPLSSPDPAPSVGEEEEIVLRIGGMT